MSNKVIDINIKNRTYFLFNDNMNIENFNLNNMKTDKKSYKNIFIYYIGYGTIKEYIKIYSVNPLFLIFRYVKYEELWIKIRDLIRSITKNSDDYDYDGKYGNQT